MIVKVKVLEEALCVQPVLADHFSELVHTILDHLTIIGCWLSASVDGLETHIIQVDRVVFLEVLLGKYLINSINEVSPANMFTLFGSFKGIGQ